jgi:hypothetical protein
MPLHARRALCSLRGNRVYVPFLPLLLRSNLTETDYIGGCTDPSFSAAACPATCSDQTLPDVVYNETTDIWHCCGVDSNGDVRCDTPTAETFSAPAPSALSATFTVGASPSTASASLSSTSSTSSSPTSSTSSPTQSPKLSAGGLSGGAKAGIGIGCAIVGLAILGLLAWFFAHRRNKHSIEQGPLMSYKADTPVELMSYKKDKPAELPSRSVRAELG